MSEPIEFTRISHDVNGNPRYVCHFLNLVTPEEREAVGTRVGFVSELYAIALRRAHRIGGRKYHTRSYGGGIVFQSYNIEETARYIAESLKK